jgi:8-oxo-dGTP pyrophosphatase MutT (NUDIX family)
VADLEAALEARHPGRLPQHNVMLAVAGVVIDDGRVLMVRDVQGFWAGVGGWIDAGESPEEAIVREFQEELGVDAVVIRPLHPFIAWNVPRSDSPLHFVLFFFEVRLASRDFTLQEGEVTDYRWVTKDELPGLDMLPHARATIEERVNEWLSG